MAINISNILTQLNTKMSADSSATTTDLLRRVQAYQSLNNIKGVQEVKHYGDLPAIDSNNIGQLFYVSASTDDSFGTFFFSKALLNDDGNYDITNSAGWQKIVLNANDSDNFADITLPPHSFPGTVSGYTSGGFTPPETNTIDKFPFSTDVNATDVGDLLSNSRGGAGQSSETNGYVSGGAPYSNLIQKFPFAVDANSTDVGDLLFTFAFGGGQSSETHGYTSGGLNPAKDIIQKFPFSVDANATDVGDLIASLYASAGQSSTEHGYNSGSYPSTDIVHKFPFASDANAVTVGYLTIARGYHAGQSSAEYGYNAGGSDTPTTRCDVIDKFSFSSNANATDVGDLLSNIYRTVGQSSTDNGYVSGGADAPLYLNIIQKFPFSTDANSTDVGDLTVGRSWGSGQQD